MASFGERVAAARKYKDLSQSALARLVDVKPQNIQYLESGRAKRSSYTATIARVCGVDPVWLESGIGQMLPLPQPEPVETQSKPMFNEFEESFLVLRQQVRVLEMRVAFVESKLEKYERA